MDALFPPFLAALLGEVGDKTQLLAILLAVRYRSPRSVLAGIAIAAIANSLIGAAAGLYLHDLVNFRAIALMTALSFLFAGAGNLRTPHPPTLSSYGPAGAAVTSALAFFILGFGDKTQFITLTLAARTNSLWLTGVGSAAGIILANVPAVILGAQLPQAVPIGRIRQGVAILFLLVGLIVAVNALGLV